MNDRGKKVFVFILLVIALSCLDVMLASYIWSTEFTRLIMGYVVPIIFVIGMGIATISEIRNLW